MLNMANGGPSLRAAESARKSTFKHGVIPDLSETNWAMIDTGDKLGGGGERDGYGCLVSFSSWPQEG